MSVGLFAGDVTRTWELCDFGERVLLCLHHNTMTGTRYLTVRGVELRESRAASTLLNVDRRGHSIPFAINEALDGEVRITPANKTGFEYACVVADEVVPEANETSADDVGNIRVTMPATEVDRDARGGPVVFYRVDTMGPTKGTSKHKRFSEFHEMHAAVRSAFKGNAILSSLPSPPEKGIKLLEDHLDKEFVRTRRLQLQTYMRQMAAIGRVSRCQPFQQFLGLVDESGAASGSGAAGAGDTAGARPHGDSAVGVSGAFSGAGKVVRNPWREVEVTFNDGPLGVTLKTGDVVGEPAVIAAFRNDPDTGAPGQAEAAGTLHVGDILCRVNGEFVVAMDYADALGRIRGSPRPFKCTFLTPPVGDASEATGAGAGASGVGGGVSSGTTTAGSGLVGAAASGGADDDGEEEGFVGAKPSAI